MFLADYHIHSTCSPDGKNTMAEMANAAFDRGMTQVLFTDHSDFDIPDTMQIDAPVMPPEQVRQLNEARRLTEGRGEILVGLELGEANHQPEKAVKVYATPGYDFILGSLHNLLNTPDFYYLKYHSLEECFDLYDKYMDELIELSILPCFDCMAHIGYCIRYMHKQGMDANLTMARYGDKIEKLLRNLIERGLGIEMNVADLIPGGRSNPLLMPLPTEEILRFYRELGGEIITVGSDAHQTKAAGLGISEGYELLRSLGFRYVTEYRQHKPSFIKL